MNEVRTNQSRNRHDAYPNIGNRFGNFEFICTFNDSVNKLQYEIVRHQYNISDLKELRSDNPII